MPKRKTQRPKTALTFANIESIDSPALNDEDKMLDFIRDNSVLWNLKMTDYRRKDKKAKLWVDQAALMGKSVENLKG